uniref:Uncharacterized protein n=1 Tax=Eutreptiella gymnastica TaxID=73025 RepID=A0A7S1IMV6_9EUGL|mmetsp:Transcript_28645/g.51383  ORF Transcript_28645/g.51383 Transcript_28645/m.51383 type:complete len:118 (+) Transcript_28645:320-673(+)
MRLETEGRTLFVETKKKYYRCMAYSVFGVLSVLIAFATPTCSVILVQAALASCFCSHQFEVISTCTVLVRLLSSILSRIVGSGWLSTFQMCTHSGMELSSPSAHRSPPVDHATNTFH